MVYRTDAPPCAATPERWVDRADRTHALVTCLQCPVRRWCAREALRVRATWGMWAGIWIDGRFADVADRLRAIADEPTPDRSSAAAVAPVAPPVAVIRPPLPRPRPASGTATVGELVLARSAGHCEILGAGCQLTAELRCDRIIGRPTDRMTSAAELYAACRPCAAAIDAMPAAEVHAQGYRVGARSRVPDVPFRWRGTRWVLLGGRGQMREIDRDQPMCRAS